MHDRRSRGKQKRTDDRASRGMSRPPSRDVVVSALAIFDKMPISGAVLQFPTSLFFSTDGGGLRLEPVIRMRYKPSRIADNLAGWNVNDVLMAADVSCREQIIGLSENHGIENCLWSIRRELAGPPGLFNKRLSLGL